MKLNRKVALSAALTVVSGLLSSTALAVPEYRVDVSASSGTRNVQGPTDSRSQTSAESVSLGATSSVTETISGIRPVFSAGNSSASGSAGPGLMSLFAWAGASTNAVQRPSTGSSSARAFGALHDAFTILGLNCLTCASGSRGTMTFAVSLDGGLGGTGHRSSDVPSSNGGGGFSFASNWSSVFGTTSGYGNAGGSAGGTYRGNQDGDFTTSTGLGTGLHTFTLDFAFGQPIDLQWQSTINASGSVTSTGNEQSFIGEVESLADFASTFAWGGILSILDQYGAPVSLFTAFNTDGINYASSFASSVPEPSPLALLLIGLLVLATAKLADWRPSGTRERSWQRCFAPIHSPAPT